MAGESDEQDSSRVKLTQCLCEQGLDVPDSGGHGAFAQLSPAERECLQAALRGPCRKYQSEAFGDASEPQSQEFLDAITAFTACLRKQGVDVPDPDPNNPFGVLHSVDRSDPKIAAASAKCHLHGDRLDDAHGPGGDGHRGRNTRLCRHAERREPPAGNRDLGVAPRTALSAPIASSTRSTTRR